MASSIGSSPAGTIRGLTVGTSLNGFSRHDHGAAFRPCLCELNGMPPPDWHDDVSVFHRPALNALVGYIDEQLKVTPSIADMALLVGMSPSHFTKKFRQSTELSVQRFVNRRRIRKSLDSPRNTSGTLAGITVDLGFSPQSHFTRFFGGLTRVTPAKYRKQLRRPLG